MLYVVLMALACYLVRRLWQRQTWRRRQDEAPPICTDCAFAHLQYAVNGQRAISCMFGAGLHPVNLNVQYCTDYRSRRLRESARAQVGFVRQIAGIEPGPVEAAAAAEDDAAAVC